MPSELEYRAMCGATLSDMEQHKSVWSVRQRPGRRRTARSDTERCRAMGNGMEIPEIQENVEQAERVSAYERAM